MLRPLLGLRPECYNTFPPLTPHSLYNLNPDKRYVCIYMYKGDTDTDTDHPG